MKLLIIAGFLGSGKTTLLLKIASRLVNQSQEVTIIENEIGEIGIDGQYLDSYGLRVQELFGGCVCCTLSVGLIETIDRIIANSKPDWIILEATGVARPVDIIGNLHRLKREIGKIHVMTVVDAGRYAMLMSVMEPLITSQIESADLIVLNKIDQVESESTERITEDIVQLNTNAPVLKMSAHEKNNPHDFITYFGLTDS